MLTEKQIQEVREHLEKTQNPVFLFDNDADGLCSFLLFQRYIKRGKGISVKSFLTEDYFSKAMGFNPDYIFILDRPEVPEEFLKEAEKVNIPIVWIDHHDMNIDIKKYSNIYYYNPMNNKEKSNEPVAYICYKIIENEKDLWVAVTGCVSDMFIPNFYKKFEKEYPDISCRYNSVFDIYYNSRLGEIVRMLNFALKDRTRNIVIMMKFLAKIKSPYEILEESAENKTMHKRLEEVYRKYEKLLKKAISKAGKEKFLFFEYKGDTSISSELANELKYKFPEKIIVTIYAKGERANVSIRGDNVRELILEAIQDIKNSTGGGHRNASGAQIPIKELGKFKERLRGLIKRKI